MPHVPNKDVRWNRLGRAGRAAWGGCFLATTLATAISLSSVAGCATPGVPVHFAQFGWGRSLRLAGGGENPPDFEDTAEGEDGVVVVDPDAGEVEVTPPRRLFGFGKPSTPESRKKDDEIRDSRRLEANRDTGSWWSTTPYGSSADGQATADNKRQQQEQFADAEALYREGHLEEAQKLLKPLTKKKANFWKSLNFLSVDSSYQHDHNRLREDSMFLLAESYYELHRYGPAKDYYEALLKDYPSTRHLNKSTKRLFKIAQVWLDFPEFATTNDVTPVNLEDPRATELPPREKPPHSAILVPNMLDRTRPVFDTPGHALEALKAIWLYDPRGPLADDAIMMTASHHLRIGNYEEADRYFSMLREEYPNSPHLQTSFVLGSHVKLMSYQGAAYDEKQLEDARLLKESTLRLFPNLPEKQRIKGELARIEEARAQRLWERVEFYRRKGKPAAQVIYAEELVKTYPKSSYSDKARELLAELKPEAAAAAPADNTPRSVRPTTTVPTNPPQGGGPFQRPAAPQTPSRPSGSPGNQPSNTQPSDEPPTANPNPQRNLPVNFQRPRSNTQNAPPDDTSGKAKLDFSE